MICTCHAADLILRGIQPLVILEGTIGWRGLRSVGRQRPLHDSKQRLIRPRPEEVHSTLTFGFRFEDGIERVIRQDGAHFWVLYAASNDEMQAVVGAESHAGYQ